MGVAAAGRVGLLFLLVVVWPICENLARKSERERASGESADGKKRRRAGRGRRARPGQAGERAGLGVGRRWPHDGLSRLAIRERSLEVPLARKRKGGKRLCVSLPSFLNAPSALMDARLT
jgi:hypothetical protein